VISIGDWCLGIGEGEERVWIGELRQSVNIKENEQLN
jgi:hypothetical protein